MRQTTKTAPLREADWRLLQKLKLQSGGRPLYELLGDMIAEAGTHERRNERRNGMADIGWAKAQLQVGRRIRQGRWAEGCYLILMGDTIRVEDRRRKLSMPWRPDVDDVSAAILGDDWELYEPEVANG